MSLLPQYGPAVSAASPTAARGVLFLLLLTACNREELDRLTATQARLEHELAAKTVVAGDIARYRRTAEAQHLDAAVAEAAAVDPASALGRLTRAASQVQFGVEKIDAESDSIHLQHATGPSWAVSALYALSAAVPTLSLRRLDFGESSWTAEGDLATPHRCCALQAGEPPGAPGGGLLCVGRCRTLRTAIDDLRGRVAEEDRQIDLAKFVAWAEFQAAAARPMAIGSEMHLLSALFGGEDPILLRGHVEFRDDLAEVTGGILGPKKRPETVVARVRGSFEVERIDASGGFRATFRRKPGTLPAAPVRDAVLSWQHD